MLRHRMPEGDGPITLKEVQLRLGAQQHVLIHLCEKGVIEPDFAETTGRGKRREFSERNVFEFAVALALRSLEVSVATTALLVRLLRTFSKAAQKAVPEFDVLGGLHGGGLQVVMYLYDDRDVVFELTDGPATNTPILLGAQLPPDVATAKSRVQRLDKLPQDYSARLEVNLTRIARSARKEPVA